MKDFEVFFSDFNFSRIFRPSRWKLPDARLTWPIGDGDESLAIRRYKRPFIFMRGLQIRGV
jgi:hypothetical protein